MPKAEKDKQKEFKDLMRKDLTGARTAETPSPSPTQPLSATDNEEYICGPHHTNTASMGPKKPRERHHSYMLASPLPPHKMCVKSVTRCETMNYGTEMRVWGLG